MTDEVVDLPYMRLWVSDLLADDLVQELDVEEFGAYMRLLCISWKRGHIPADPKRRAKLLGVSSRREADIWELLGPKWESDGNGGLVNPRQERERLEAQALHRKRVEAGQKGGRAKARRSSYA